MVRKAALIIGLTLATPAAAQSSTTNCQKDYFGNVTCNTTQTQGINWGLLNQPPSPQPNYAEQQLRQRELRLRERELKLREQAAREAEAAPPPAAIPPPTSVSGKYDMSASQRSFVDIVLQYCVNGTPIGDVPEDRREITGAFCYAYDQGRIAEITRDKR